MAALHRPHPILDLGTFYMFFSWSGGYFVFHFVERPVSAPIVTHSYGIVWEVALHLPHPISVLNVYFMSFLCWSEGYFMFCFVKLLGSAPIVTHSYGIVVGGSVTPPQDVWLSLKCQDWSEGKGCD